MNYSSWLQFGVIVTWSGVIVYLFYSNTFLHFTLNVSRELLSHSSIVTVNFLFSGTYCHKTGTRPPSCKAPRELTIHSFFMSNIESLLQLICILSMKLSTSKHSTSMIECNFSCYETIMFGRVTYARRGCKARALSVYLIHILQCYRQLFFETEREYKLCPSTCVLLIEIPATINLYYSNKLTYFGLSKKVIGLIVFRKKSFLLNFHFRQFQNCRDEGWPEQPFDGFTSSTTSSQHSDSARTFVAIFNTATHQTSKIYGISGNVSGYQRRAQP